MIDTEDMDLEERKDLLYDIRDGKVKYDDVIWHHTYNEHHIPDTPPYKIGDEDYRDRISCQDEWWYYDSHRL